MEGKWINITRSICFVCTSARSGNMAAIFFILPHIQCLYRSSAVLFSDGCYWFKKISKNEKGCSSVEASALLRCEWFFVVMHQSIPTAPMPPPPPG